MEAKSSEVYRQLEGEMTVLRKIWLVSTIKQLAGRCDVVRTHSSRLPSRTHKTTVPLIYNY